MSEPTRPPDVVTATLGGMAHRLEQPCPEDKELAHYLAVVMYNKVHQKLTLSECVQAANEGVAFVRRYHSHLLPMPGQHSMLVRSCLGDEEVV